MNNYTRILNNQFRYLLYITADNEAYLNEKLTSPLEDYELDNLREYNATVRNAIKAITEEFYEKESFHG